MTKKKTQKTTKEKKPENKVAQKKEQELDIESQLAAAQQSAKDNWERSLRAQAEVENIRRRSSRDLENAHKYALDSFVKALLEVKDSLSIGLKSATDEGATIEHIIEGLKMTDKVFLTTLEKFGVNTINPTGEKFNPELHEAITMIPMPDKESNRIIEVVQTGFTLNGRIIRPAMVVVVE